MLIAERMLELETKSIINLGVVCQLTQAVVYKRWDGVAMVEVTLDKGTFIHVDETKEMGSHGDDYFDIAKDEYKVAFPN